MSADAEFARLAREYLDDRAERHPDIATGLGDHRFDARLADPSAQALDDERRALDGWAARLAADRSRRPVGRAPGGRRDDGGQRGAAGVRTRRAARAHLEPAAGQPGQGHLPAAGQGLRPAARPAGFGGRQAGRHPRRAGRGPPAARAHAPGPHWRPPSGSSTARSRWSASEIDAALEAAPQCAAQLGRGAPGRAGGADRAPGLALRAARRSRMVSPIRGSGRNGSPASCRSP